MPYLAEEFARQLAARNHTIDQLVAASGLSRGQLYLWKGGHQTSITPDHFALLAHALSSSVDDHARLVRAHLLDEKFGPGSDMVDVVIIGADELHDAPISRSKRERALAILSTHSVGNKELADLLIALASYVEP